MRSIPLVQQKIRDKSISQTQSLKYRPHSSNNSYYNNVNNFLNFDESFVIGPNRPDNEQTQKKLSVRPGFIVEPQKHNKRFISTGSFKSLEQLHQQNIQLKTELNKITIELQQLRAKFQVKSKRSEDRGKQLDLQFQKEIYWCGSKSHLISGIKHQYNKLKKQHLQLVKQHSSLKIAFMNANITQTLISIQVLEQQNKRLADKLQKMYQKSFKLSPDSQKLNSIILAQQSQRICKLQQILKDSENKIHCLRLQEQKKIEKIKFLQSLLIQKDNEIHHIGRKNRKIERFLQKSRLVDQNHKQEILKIENHYRAQMKQTQKEHQQEKNFLRHEHTTEMNDLKLKISQLLENNSELQNTLIKFKTNNLSSSSISKRKASISNNGHNFPNLLKLQQNSFQPYTQNNMTNSMSWSKNVQILQVSNAKAEDSEIQVGLCFVQNLHMERTMQRADRMHSSKSRKLRKVNFSQVEQIGEFIRYRLMGKKINHEEIKNYFIYNNANSNMENFPSDYNQENQLWLSQYINMKEIKNILKQNPFYLEQKPAQLLSRYLIEDFDQEYVYCDEGNQNKREVVKSIFRSLVGDYYISNSTNEAQINQFKLKYLTNFYSALKTYYPNGKVPKKKFTELLLSMGSELSQQSVEIFTARVIDKSSSLVELQYGFLYDI